MGGPVDESSVGTDAWGACAMSGAPVALSHTRLLLPLLPACLSVLALGQRAIYMRPRTSRLRSLSLSLPHWGTERSVGRPERGKNKTGLIAAVVTGLCFV
jgi:hypothetical protein